MSQHDPGSDKPLQPRTDGLNRRLPAILLLLLSPLLSGCLVHTYRVQQPKMPPVVMSAEADQLVRLVNEHAQKVQSLKASVGFQVSVGGERKGKVTDYTTLSGYILLREPEKLRVLGLLPVVHSPAFDLASDGQRFTLVVPHNNKAYTGTDTLTTRSPNALENLRPNIFFDTMLIRPIGPDDLVFVTKENKTRTDAATHELMVLPEYILTIVRRKPNSQEMIRERDIHFDRTTLMPNGIDIYDSSGNLQTQAVYGDYVSFGEQRFPATITIRRPIDEYQIVLSIQKLTLNQSLNDNQFKLDIPDGYTVQKLD